MTINGCNELAFYFSQYLKKINMPVNVIGDFWDVFDTWEKVEIPDYRNFMLYAEGNSKSVSADFECIDLVYERNISEGIIKDTYDKFKDILNRIQDRNIIIIGTDENSLNAYDLLMGYGIDIFCFASDNTDDQMKILFGKNVLKIPDVIKNIENPVFIEAKSKYSTWGFGETDYYHYIGYKRNESYYLMKDYVKIPRNGFMNILNHVIEKTECKIVIIGDYWLFLKLIQSVEARNINMYNKMRYFDVLGEHKEKRGKNLFVNGEEVSEEDICFLLLPGYIGCVDEVMENRNYWDTMKEKYLEAVYKNNGYPGFSFR